MQDHLNYANMINPKPSPTYVGSMKYFSSSEVLKRVHFSLDICRTLCTKPPYPSRGQTGLSLVHSPFNIYLQLHTEYSGGVLSTEATYRREHLYSLYVISIPLPRQTRCEN